MRTTVCIVLVLVLGLLPLFSADAPVTSLVVTAPESPVILRDTDTLVTGANFKPPLQITLVAKTDSTNIRVGYAANQVIFNWELNKEQLRVDGGPANGMHRAGAGAIPVDQYVTIKWIVLPTKQSIYVDGQLRFEHEGDYTAIDKPVKVFTHKAKVTVKSLEVRPLPPGA